MLKANKPIHVIGAGLAGCEAAYQIIRYGIPVILHEMRPVKSDEAHKTADFAELVCSNSLRANNLENAVGLLKEEMRRLDSLIMQQADKHQIPAGGALAVDREGFAQGITEFIKNHPLITVVYEEVTDLQQLEGYVVVASGPLTSAVLAENIKKLVEDGIVDGWDDPRLVSIAALRRRGFTPESIKKFVELCGISKAQSSADYAMLEYCIREDLKTKAPRMMAILDPVKLVIDNYPEGQTEMLPVVNNPENEALGSREVPFGKELYIERDDFMEEPPKKYFRMFPGNEVRLMNAYFVKCTGCVKDENGKVVEVHGTYDPESRGGNSPDGRKVKGTIHWVSAPQAKKAEVRLYENLIDEEKGVYNKEDGSLNLNPDSLQILKECYVEDSFNEAGPCDSFQFVRNGYFCIDSKDSTPENLVFNRIVSLKSSFKLPKK